ncbi:hypothetical protein CTI12_AA427430 [Artemisia annua]|uniref:Uncharacterized protein n=1 Tax=Artemisia annua TaxID=35608 RepID=A0A2U1LSU3_ARTAN|nr:hypothetical protein CTI12_AA427430 [Artemisia annua]
MAVRQYDSNSTLILYMQNYTLSYSGDYVYTQIKSVTKTSGKKEFAYNYVCLDIFTGEEHEYQVRCNTSCDCPFVFDSVYEITNISADGVLSLATKDGEARAPLSLPPVLPPPHEREPRDPRCDAECRDDCHIPFIPRYRERFRNGSCYMLCKISNGKGGGDRHLAVEVQTTAPQMAQRLIR